MRKGIRRLLLGALVLVIAALLWIGYQVYTVYSDVNRTYVVYPTLSIEPKATSIPNLLGDYRFNVLLLGSDNDKKAEEKRPLTQSMIVVNIDPVTDQVHMLSIPRDFWVPIPGHGYAKIDNAAKYGGIELAKATVEKLFHIKIDYYAWVGLAGFSNVVNDFGGVTLDVTHPILDDFYPNDQTPGDPYAYTRIFIPPGWRHMSGPQALQYVRSRHGDAVGDFGRSQRQQQVLLQLRKKATGWNLVLKVQELAHDLRDSVRQDLASGSDITRFLDIGRLARRIAPSDIHRVVLSAPTYCSYAVVDGQDVLEPHWKVIMPLVRKEIRPGRSTPPPTTIPTPSPTPHSAASPTATPTSLPSPSSSPLPSPTPRATQLPRVLRRLPGKLIWAASGTFFEMDRNRSVHPLFAPNIASQMNAADMPAFTRGGRRLTFMRWAPGPSSNIFTYQLGSSTWPRPLTNDAPSDPKTVNNYLWAAYPSWSPDGKTILFSHDAYKLAQAPSELRQLDLAIYAMNSDGTNLRQISAPAVRAGGDTDPQFRGTGTQYLYVRWAYHMQDGVGVGQPYSQLVIGDLRNPALHWTLTPDSGQIMQPALSRGGGRVAYIQAHGGISQLVVARIAHTSHGPALSASHVIASGEIGQPAFTPDGRWISYLQANGDGFSIVMEPSSGGTVVQLDEPGTGVDALSRPVWVK